MSIKTLLLEIMSNTKDEIVLLLAVAAPNDASLLLSVLFHAVLCSTQRQVKYTANPQLLTTFTISKSNRE
jgi:hypothetical protein